MVKEADVKEVKVEELPVIVSAQLPSYQSEFYYDNEGKKVAVAMTLEEAITEILTTVREIKKVVG